MASTEARDASHFLILLDQGVGLPIDVGERNFDLDLATGDAVFVSISARVFFGFSGAHIHLSEAGAAAESK